MTLTPAPQRVTQRHEFNFPQDGSGCGALMRARDWSTSPLGDPTAWPQSLRTVVGLMLASKFPMFLAWGSELGLLYNDPYAEILSTKHPAALGLPFQRVWPEIWPDILPLIEAAMAGEAVYNEDLPLIVHRRGFDEQASFTFSYSPVRDEHGAVAGLFCTVVETTSRILAEQRLRQSQERLEFALAAGGAVGAFDWDLKADRIYADARFARLYSVDPDHAAAGAPIAEFLAGIHPDDRAKVAKVIETSIAAAGDLQIDYRLLLPDASIRWVHVRARVDHDEGGVPARMTGVVIDITERKATELALHASEARLREVNADLENQVAERVRARSRTWQLSPDLMGAMNPQGYFERSNPAWQTVLGWSEAEVAVMSIFELLHPDDVEPTRQRLELAITGRPIIRFPNRFRCKNGAYRWISWVGIPDERMVYCTGRDITEEKQRQEDLALAQDALRQSQKMEAIGQLTGGIAHDFNNLLAGISGCMEMMRSRIAEGRTGELERYIDAAHSSAQRAAALTHRLLAFTRRQTLAPKPTNVNRLIDGMEDLISRTIGPAIDLEIIGAAELWTVEVDPNQLENALLNLCINARDAMPDGGRLSIETANHWFDDRAACERDLPPGPYVSLCITDTGPGMTPEIAARAFDPFFTTKPAGLGTGLGLSMVYGFVRQSGGRASIHSAPGKGAVLCLYFPRHDADAEVEPASPANALHRADQGETVLVVDDEAIVRILVTEILQELGYAVIEAADGATGLEVLRSNARIDLLVSDVGLPGGMNGRQMADAGRELRPGLKVLFITGYAENAVLNHGDLEPGMHVLTKPFAMEMLASRARGLIEGEAAIALPTDPGPARTVEGVIPTAGMTDSRKGFPRSRRV